MVHEETSGRVTWSPYGSAGWCLGTAPHRRICHTIYVPKTKAEIIVKSARLFPHKISVPQNTLKEETLEAALGLTKALYNDILPMFQGTNETSEA